jgi:hypothetical protein
VELILWSGNLKSQILDVCRTKNTVPRHFEMPDVNVHVVISEMQGGLQQALTQDPLLKARMMEAGGAVVADMAQLMAYQIGVTHIEAAKIAENTALTESLKKTQLDVLLGKLPNNLAQTKTQILPKAQNAAMAVWNNLCVSKSEYRKYQIQAGLNIAAGTAKVIISTVTTVGTAGATLALGIFGILSGAAGIAGEFWNLSKDAEKVEGEVFTAIMNTLKKKNRNSGWGQIMTSAETIARKVAPTDLVIDTPIKCKELNEQYGHKLQGLDLKSHDIAIQLNSALEKSDGLDAQLKKEEDERLGKVAAAAPAPGPGGRRNAMSLGNVPGQDSEQSKALAKLEAVIQGRIEEVEKLSQRVNTGKKLQATYQGFIDDLVRDRVPKFMPQIAEGVAFVADVFSLQWQDALRDASIDLAKTFGPEVVNQTVEMFQKRRQANA